MGDQVYVKTSKEVHANLKFIGGKMRYDKPEQTFSKIIRFINKRMVLVLDEAQMIRVGRDERSPKIKKATELFDELHNSQSEYGLVFLIAGLSNTESSFKEFQISRFNSDCVIDLSVLEKESEQKIFQDYIVKGAMVNEKHPELNHWYRADVKRNASMGTSCFVLWSSVIYNSERK